MSEQTQIVVNCLVWGFPMSSVFTLKVPAHEIVQDLKKQILNENPPWLGKLPSHHSSLLLRKMDPIQVPDDTEYLEDLIGPSVDHLPWLRSHRELSSIFTERSEPLLENCNPLHIVVDVIQPGAFLLLLCATRLKVTPSQTYYNVLTT